MLKAVYGLQEPEPWNSQVLVTRKPQTTRSKWCRGLCPCSSRSGIIICYGIVCPLVLNSIEVEASKDKLDSQGSMFRVHG